MKEKLLLLFLLCLTSACGYEEVSVPTTTNIILESYVDGDAFIEYDINILSTLSVSSNENYILAKVINRSINESNIVLFVQNKRATFDQFVLDGVLNMPGVGHIDLGLSNDGFVEVPLRVADGLRLYR